MNYDANKLFFVHLHVQLNLTNQAKYVGGGGFGVVRFAAKLSHSRHMMYLNITAQLQNKCL